MKVVATAAPVVREDEQLRVVSEALWKAAHDRMAQTYRAYLPRNDGTVDGKPSSGLESQYLLSGFMRCGVCTGNVIVQRKTGKRGRPQLV